ncbi:DUF3107 domain-containing protein [Cutibacterium equinum]|uniref:DUF3107 domain-containing protein n=1 Tax=Cutibacterium equinum TaxID=3016342 RepID=A0ABY7QXH6_9ACTN|nr:DUF3107 domain-containing protein [Cutibacterium equinum]WCC79109.1 DUF3107 domain-containing protein [Cutibacterium equinum]
MEIKIGIVNTAREVSIDAQDSAESIERQLRDSLSKPDAVLTLTDAKGRKVLVPARGIAYLDMGQPHSRQVGFGAA